MTPWMLVTLGLAVVGQIVYHIGQRAVPTDASPFAVLTLAYFAAGVLCMMLAWPLGAFAPGMSLRSALTWPTWVIAVTIVAIEVGYLTAYRSGWTMGTGFATASTITVFGLALVGWASRGNALSLKQLTGLALSCLGVWLLSQGPRAT
jgi:multidrug transporter EmrE-like cation transporter